LVAAAGESLQRRLDVLLQHEDVKILGAANDPGVRFQGVRAADQERNLRLDEPPHGGPIKRGPGGGRIIDGMHGWSSAEERIATLHAKVWGKRHAGSR
jgi:hypothetical protein